jgi:hypothetical protein
VDTVLLVLVRPLFMLVLLAIATTISMLLHRIIPDGPTGEGIQRWTERLLTALARALNQALLEQQRKALDEHTRGHHPSRSVPNTARTPTGR